MKRKYVIATMSTLGVLAISWLLPEQSQAASAGSGLPWEGPLQTITKSIQGPVAYGISLIAVIACGGGLVWGGEIGDFSRRIILLVLVISLVVLATNFMSTIFNTSGAIF